MSEYLPVIGTVLSILSAAVGGGVLLIKMNFKLGQQALRAKQELYAERFETMKGALTNFQTELLETKNELKEELGTALKKIEATGIKIEETKTIMVNYVESTDKKLKAFETQIIKLNNDFIFVKSKTKGPL